MKPSLSILIIFFIGVSCNLRTDQQGDFYSYSKSGDLWRVPLIEPYEIVSPTNFGNDDWFLIIKNHNIEGSNYFRSSDNFQFSSIKTVGILDSIIVVTNENEYWPKLSGQYPSTLIIDIKTRKQFLYSNEHHSLKLKDKIKELQIEEIQMLEWEKVKDDFLNNQKLPENWNKRVTTTP